MLYIVISLLVLCWIVGLGENIGGGSIHTLLVLAVALLIFNVLTGRKAGV